MSVKYLAVSEKKCINSNLQMDEHLYRDFPRKQAHFAPAVSIARVRLRNFCLRKRPSFLASRRFA